MQVTSQEAKEIRTKIDEMRKKGHNFLNSIRGYVKKGVVVGRYSSARGNAIEKAANKLFLDANDLEEKWYCALYPEQINADDYMVAIKNDYAVLENYKYAA